MGPLEALAGSYTWTGLVCDGVPVAIAYTIDEQGLTVTDVTGPPSQIRERGRKVSVRFRSFRASVRFELDRHGGEYELEIKPRPGRCTIGDPGTPPTTGLPTTTTAPPTTVPPTTTTVPPPTVPPTTTTVPPTTTTVPPTTTTAPPQTQYLTYQVGSAGAITLSLLDPPALQFWAFVPSPGWAWYTSRNDATHVQVLFSNNVTREQVSFDARLVNGQVMATYTTAAGTVTPPPPTVSTVPPAITLPSG